MSKTFIPKDLHSDSPLPDQSEIPSGPLNIGSFELKHRVIPAPMCGITDRPTRGVQRDTGLSVTFTQMFSAEGIVRDDNKTWSMIDIEDEPEHEGPVAIQLFGGNPESLGEAARKIQDEGAAWIDLNMGCPARKVTGNNCGAALMKKPELVKDIIANMRKGCDKIPVTAKFRAGWDEGATNMVEIGRICQEEGADAVAIHPRTREQKFEGRSNWDLIGVLKDALEIPVIGNGDINSGEDALRMMAHTGCDAVMIGRGALGNPWVFEECIEAIHYPERFAERRKRPLLEDREGAKAPYITLEERLDMLEKHAELMMNWKGEERGLIELRKHGVQYLKGLQSAKAFKTQFLTIRTFDALQQLFDTIREQLSRQPEMAGATQPQQTDVAG